ncbi:MAG TPA: serine/threonine-protein kinase [Kofleriaceae bacterium]|nr:serine/threonine-protein kinase [Kofleriaceae bacterium]
MRYDCSACQRSFDEPGFCPYDGTPLRAAADKPTVVSAYVEAQVGALDPESETIDDPASVVRAVSAAADTSAAVAAVKERIDDYDRLIGQTLDKRYHVLRKIGEGGMGVVFAARHDVIERPLAIKVLKREASRDTATVRRFMQEARAASRIGHPHIVDVTDFGTTDDGMTYSVMEYVDGTTLAKTIKHAAPLPPERVVRIAMQIARALGAAHDKGIVHRDLKPENVFLTEREGRPDFVKIVDFGIAKVQPAEGTAAGPKLTRAGSVFGTPEYMAPEQAAGRPDTDRRVDIYALGTIMYEMLVGLVPHRGGNMIRTIAMQMLDPITPPSLVRPDLAIPAALEAIVMKALAKNRDERYQTMQALHDACEAIAGRLAELPPTVSLPPLPPGADPMLTPQPAPRRHKPSTRQLHEPEFVAGPLSLHHVFADPADDEPPPRRRWPMLALAAALVLGGGGSLVIALHADHEDTQVAAARDAGPAPDAGRVAAELADAGAIAAEDAAVVVVIAPPDAGRHGVAARDGGGGATLPVGPHPDTVTVEVMTEPGDAEIYIDGHHRGPSGVRIEAPWGTSVTVECRAPMYIGHKAVVFDGSVSAVMCIAEHLPLCVKGLKNPLQNCDPGPSP